MELHRYSGRFARATLSVATALFALVLSAPALTAQNAKAPSASSPTDPAITAADQGRILGSEKAPIWMLVVSDFQCPFCKRWHDDTWETLKKEYVSTGKVRVAFMNYPLNMHPNARPTAIAAMCASAQGKFWPVSDGLFATQNQWKDLKDPSAVIDGVLKKAGVDGEKAHACMASAKGVPSIVDADQARMARAGTGPTPTFFIGKAKIEGAQPLELFRKAIDAELAAAKPR